jgi:hypothetical protein
MNEMELLTRFRDEIPPNVIPARAESALALAIQAAGSPVAAGSRRSRAAKRAPAAWGARRAWRLALVGGISLAVAAVGLIAQSIKPAGPRPHAAMTVRQLAVLTAAAAAAQPDVKPGQWVYRDVRAAWGMRRWTFELWSTADSTNAAYFADGKLSFDCGTPGHRGAGRCGNQSLTGAYLPPQTSSRPAPVPILVLTAPFGNIPVKYSHLGYLPRDPRALDRYLSHFHQPWLGSASASEFYIIEEMLGSYVMPAGLTSELYLALGDIPGVTVDQHAVDAAGRAGIGFKLVTADEEIIVSPHSFHLMGQQATVGSGPHAKLYGTAILREALVSRPGART